MRYRQLILGFALLAGFSTASHALIVSPGDCTAVNGCVTTDVNGGNDLDVFPVLDTLQYKWDVVEAMESGPLSGSYLTSFFTYDSESEVSGLTIRNVSGGFVSCAPSDPCYLVVKDGAHQPARYLFNLAILGWNGKSDLTLEDFWSAPVQGEVSHAAIYSGISAVPVPAAAWLFGTALIGFIGLSRRTKV